MGNCKCWFTGLLVQLLFLVFRVVYNRLIPSKNDDDGDDDDDDDIPRQVIVS